MADSAYGLWPLVVLDTAVFAVFTAGTPGHYRYLCPVPEHAQKGMTGTFTVT